MTSQESQLIEEIEFWREMINGRQHASDASPALERMRHALALAERRLLMLAPAGAVEQASWPEDMSLSEDTLTRGAQTKGPERKH